MKSLPCAPSSAASLTGLKSMTATRPWLLLEAGSHRYAIMAEVPCVVVNVMRSGRSTGMPTKGSQGDCDAGALGDSRRSFIIALTASNHQDLFLNHRRGIQSFRTYRTPVILLLDEVIGHMREKLIMPQPGRFPCSKARTSVRKGPDYHPYLPREDGRLPCPTS